MLRAFYSSATGMRAQEVLIDVTANNLANVNTNGFKRHQVDFADLLYANERPAGAITAAGHNAPTGLQLGSGVRVFGTTKNFQQGPSEATGIPTNVAIEGAGFFQVTMPDGTQRYTRDGSFNQDSTGTLVNGDGYPVEGGAINIPDGVRLATLSIGQDGTVSYSENGQTTELGKIQLWQFRNPVGLNNEGGNLFSESPVSGQAIAGTGGIEGFGTIRQGSVEKSNVEVVQELVSLITAQRAYEINSRAIRAGDEMLSTTSQIIR